MGPSKPSSSPSNVTKVGSSPSSSSSSSSEKQLPIHTSKRKQSVTHPQQQQQQQQQQLQSSSSQKSQQQPPQSSNNGTSSISQSATNSMDAQSPHIKPEVNLPPGWISVWSKSQKRWYFFDTKTNKSVWQWPPPGID